MTYRFKRDDDELWLACFLAALSSVTEDVNNRHDAVQWGCEVADTAMEEIQKRRAAIPPPPLFEPLLQQQAVKEKVDEDDSSFAIGRL